jgi:hypothetical protein
VAGRRQHPEARERPPIIGKAPVMERSHHHIYPRLALRMNSGPPAAVPKNFRASSVFDYGLLARAAARRGPRLYFPRRGARCVATPQVAAALTIVPGRGRHADGGNPACVPRA